MSSEPVKTTFRELGIPFPLFEAPIDDSRYAGQGTCSICNAKDAHCFSLGIGTDLVVNCLKCNTANSLNVYDKADGTCRSCSAAIPYPPEIAAKREPKVCYSCLRAGKAALTKSTEFGMVTLELAFLGRTHGVPGLGPQDQFETVMIDADEDWIAVKVPEETLLELLRTPGYHSWQEEIWLFCCKYPMTYLGSWEWEDFDARAKDGNGEKLYYEIVSHVPENSWDALSHRLSVYVFECKCCGKLSAYWDSD